MGKFLDLYPEVFSMDINDLSVKLVKLKKKRRGFSIISIGESKIPEGIVKEGVIQNQSVLANIIRSTCRNAKGKKLSATHVVSSLPEEKSFLQVIQMPVMSYEELSSAVLFEAENYIPLPMEKAYVSFQAIGSKDNHSASHIDVLINAMPKTIVDSYVSCLKSAGLVPCALEVESHSIARALLKENGYFQPVIIIDFGQTKTSFIIVSGGVVCFTSSIPISSSQLTSAVSSSLNVSNASAEELKIKYGLTNHKDMRLAKAINPIVIDLAMQIKKYIEFYHSHALNKHANQEEKIEKVIMCGGGANLKGIAEALFKEVNITVEIGNPLLHILMEKGRGSLDISPQKALSFTAALGLALRQIGNEDF